MNAKNRLDYLDYMKAICIVMILLIHAISYGNNYYGINSLPNSIIWNFCFYTGRPLFFIISGYLCKKQKVESFYFKRLKFLIIPFLFFSCVKLAYTIFLDGQYAHADSICLQLYDAFILGRLYWFPYTLFIIDLIMPLLWVDESNRALQKRPSKALFVLLATVILNAVFNVVGIEQNLKIIPFQLTSVFQLIPYYLLGYLIKYKKDDLVRFANSINVYLKVGTLLIVSTTLAINNRMFSIDNYLLSLIFCLCSSYWVYLLSKRIKPNNLILKTIGKYTLQIHFLDPFIKVILFSTLEMVFPINNMIVILIAILNVAVCTTLTKVVSRIPFIKNCIGL